MEGGRRRLDDRHHSGSQVVVSAKGYGREYTFERPYRYRDACLAAQAAAQAGGRGLWSAGRAAPAAARPAPSPTVTPTPRPVPAPAPACDRSYPTVCIPPPPDLDGGEIPHRGFPVVGSDPYRFDGDRDGIGCE